MASTPSIHISQSQASMWAWVDLGLAWLEGQLRDPSYVSSLMTGNFLKRLLSFFVHRNSCQGIFGTPGIWNSIPMEMKRSSRQLG